MPETDLNPDPIDLNMPASHCKVAGSQTSPIPYSSELQAPTPETYTETWKLAVGEKRPAWARTYRWDTPPNNIFLGLTQGLLRPFRDPDGQKIFQCHPGA